MKKMTALAISILFAVSIMGCATMQDNTKWGEQSVEDIKRPGVEQSSNPGLNPGP